MRRSVTQNQRGDTLVEVVMALSILAVVLMTSTALATRSFLIGQTAKERTQLAADAQHHVEAARAFRDNHTWDEFLNGSTTAIPAYRGVLNALAPGNCVTFAQCLHMELTDAGSAHEFVPEDGQVGGVVSTSYIEINVIPGPGAIPGYVDLNVAYGFQAAGGGMMNVNHIQTRLANLRIGSTPGPAVPPVTCTNSNSDIMFVLDASNSMDVPFGGGYSRAAKLLSVVPPFISSVVSQLGNHVGIVQFNATAQMLSLLDYDVQALTAAVNNYNQVFGTNITSGLQMAAGELSSSRARAGSPNIVVLVTDGLPVGDTEAAVEARATIMGNAGTRIYVIQMGNAPGAEAFLRRVVADGAAGGTYANATDGTQMDGIISDIQGIVTCP